MMTLVHQVPDVLSQTKRCLLVRQAARNLHWLELISGILGWDNWFFRQNFLCTRRVMILTPDETAAWLLALASAISRMMKSLPEPLYMSQQGTAYVGDACELLLGLPDESLDLVFTSPPFALQRQKEYGNMAQDRYVDWLLSFAREVKRVLRSTGSFVLDPGGACCQNCPVRSLHNYRFIIRICDELG